MSDYREGEIENPEGFPRCPYCKEYVDLTEDQEHYYCSECDTEFTLEEAVT